MSSVEYIDKYSLIIKYDCGCEYSFSGASSRLSKIDTVNLCNNHREDVEKLEMI